MIAPKAAPPERLQLRCSHSDVVLPKVLHYSIFLPSSQKKCPARLDRKGPRRAISSPLAYPDLITGQFLVLKNGRFIYIPSVLLSILYKQPLYVIIILSKNQKRWLFMYLVYNKIDTVVNKFRDYFSNFCNL